MKSIFLSLLLAIVVLIPANGQPASGNSDSRDLLPTVDSVITTDSSTVIVSSGENTHILQFDYPPMDQQLSVSETLVRITAIIVPFASAIGIVWLILAYRQRRHRDRLRIIELSLTHGQPLPDSFFRSAGIDPQRRLLSGFYWLGAGIAIILFFAATFQAVWALGLFPLFIGIGRIVVARIETRQKEKENSRNDILDLN